MNSLNVYCGLVCFSQRRRAIPQEIGGPASVGFINKEGVMVKSLFSHPPKPRSELDMCHNKVLRTIPGRNTCAILDFKSCIFCDQCRFDVTSMPNRPLRRGGRGGFEGGVWGACA